MTETRVRCSAWLGVSGSWEIFRRRWNVVTVLEEENVLIRSWLVGVGCSAVSAPYSCADRPIGVAPKDEVDVIAEDVGVSQLGKTEAPRQLLRPEILAPLI